jgi:phosphoribosyl 1,2-cyclic phosphodiesterase
MEGFCPLASGSKGNCIYLGTKRTKILVDAGISAKAIKNKLAQIHVDLADIDAILVSHEHGDHIQGLKVLAYQMDIPILANSETAKGITSFFHDCPKFKIFSTGEAFEFGDFEIHPFSIPHDTLDPVAFTIRKESWKLGICTDLGFVTSLVERQLQLCDYLYIEANHQPSMVHACSRPPIYKQRVLGRNGHLSNEACGTRLNKLSHPKLKHVYLAHLSSECNTPETALSVVKEHLGDKASTIDISIAYQDQVSQSDQAEAIPSPQVV